MVLIEFFGGYTLENKILLLRRKWRRIRVSAHKEIHMETFIPAGFYSFLVLGLIVLVLAALGSGDETGDY